MVYEVVDKAVINVSKQATQNTFNRRKKVYCIDSGFLRFELGMVRPEFTPENVEYVENELLIRQILPSTCFVHAADEDYMRDAWRFYVKDDSFNLLQEGEAAPEVWLVYKENTWNLVESQRVYTQSPPLIVPLTTLSPSAVMEQAHSVSQP
jgi:hypothetical protein